MQKRPRVSAAALFKAVLRGAVTAAAVHRYAGWKFWLSTVEDAGLSGDVTHLLAAEPEVELSGNWLR